MKVLVGLGNPGALYALTRHNIGFMCIDAISKNLKSSSKKKFGGEVWTENGFSLLKPLTYMNLSGTSVRSLITFHKVPPSSVVVIHDDLDLLPNTMRMKIGGSSGGHNGLKSIDQAIGPNYWRLRIGIGRSTSFNPSEYVLSPFSKNELNWVREIMEHISQFYQILLTENPKNFLDEWQNKGERDEL